MAWESKYVNYGVIKIYQKTSVQVFKAPGLYLFVDIGKPIRNAQWQGNVLIVQLEDGTVRRYTDRYAFTQG